MCATLDLVNIHHNNAKKSRDGFVGDADKPQGAPVYNWPKAEKSRDGFGGMPTNPRVLRSTIGPKPKSHGTGLAGCRQTPGCSGLQLAQSRKVTGRVWRDADKPQGAPAYNWPKAEKLRDGFGGMPTNPRVLRPTIGPKPKSYGTGLAGCRQTPGCSGLQLAQSRKVTGRVWRDADKPQGAPAQYWTKADKSQGAPAHSQS
ncbi:hypothetical protein BJ508DRAFT_314674 [Ascobolus immersus RN42]|uniref:Uncharacterized protein n=1 Tax=Ascobolus immersus RN42 TaxID=1160509 RepID=A0A3N4HE73_ASCIM|nr:hypothetical protein BJ508DRAFT_314674 [Ascobolus immersus RN42]